MINFFCTRKVLFFRECQRSSPPALRKKEYHHQRLARDPKPIPDSHQGGVGARDGRRGAAEGRPLAGGASQAGGGPAPRDGDRNPPPWAPLGTPQLLHFAAKLLNPPRPVCARIFTRTRSPATYPLPTTTLFSAKPPNRDP